MDSFIGAWLTLQESRPHLPGGTRRRPAALGRHRRAGRPSLEPHPQIPRGVRAAGAWPHYLRLLPGGSSFHKLIPIVRNYAGDVLLWDVNLVLRAPEVPAVRLGRQGRLGWTTWLMPRRHATDAADLFLDASADSMARSIDAQTPTREAETVP